MAHPIVQFQQFDPGKEIGQQIGSGLGGAMQLLGQRQLVKSGLDNVNEMLKTPGTTPMQALSGLAGSLAGIPGGMQMLGQIYPVLRQDILRQAYLNRGGQQGMPGQQGLPQGQSLQPGMSVQQGMQGQQGQAPIEQSQSEEVIGGVPAGQAWESERVRNLEMGMPIEEASQQATMSLQAKTAEKQLSQNASQYAQGFFDKQSADTFPAGLSAPIKSKGSEMYERQLSAGETPQKAWNNIYPKVRDMQLQENRMFDLPGRKFFGEADTAKKGQMIRNTMPDIIKDDPEYAFSLMQDRMGFGPGEAAEMMRPDSRFNQYAKKMEPISFRHLASVPLSKRDSFLENNQKSKEKLINQTEEYLKKHFNPEKDSLLDIRGKLWDKGGVPSSEFIEIAERAFPQGSKDPRLSEFNQSEWSRLSTAIKPSISEILSEFVSGRVGRSSKMASKAIKGLRGVR